MTFELGPAAAELEETSVSRPGSYNWNHGHSKEQLREMIGILSKYLHNMVRIDTSMPKGVATARLTARRIPEKLLHVT